MPVFRAYIVIFEVKIDLIGHGRLSKLVTFASYLDLYGVFWHQKW